MPPPARGERKAVEPPADLGDRRRILGRQGERRRHSRARSTNSRTASDLARRSGASSCSSGTPSDGTWNVLSPGMLRARGWSPAPRAGDTRGAAPRRAPRTLRPRARSCRGSRAPGGGPRDGRRSPAGREASSWRPDRGRDGCATRPASRHRGQLHEPDAVRIALTELRARRQVRAGSCRRRRCRAGHQRWVRNAASTVSRTPARPTKLVVATGKAAVRDRGEKC